MHTKIWAVSQSFGSVLSPVQAAIRGMIVSAVKLKQSQPEAAEALIIHDQPQGPIHILQSTDPSQHANFDFAWPCMQLGIN